jgi:hypothetical protein
MPFVKRAAIPILVALVVVVGLIWRAGPTTKRQTTDSPPQPTEIKSAANMSGSADASQVETKKSTATPRLTEEELSLEHLQELLDDDQTHDKALTKALSMVDGSVAEQFAAIDAFRWLGGRKAMRALIQMRRQAYAPIADEAGDVLAHLLTEALYQSSSNHDNIPDDGIVILDEGIYDEAELNEGEAAYPDTALWIQAIEEAPSAEARSELLVILEAYPIEQAVPILLALFDNPNEDIREEVREHLQSITGGEEILTREQGEEWLANHSTSQGESTVQVEQ